MTVSLGFAGGTIPQIPANLKVDRPKVLELVLAAISASVDS